MDAFDLLPIADKEKSACCHADIILHGVSTRDWKLTDGDIIIGGIYDKWDLICEKCGQSRTKSYE